jgi:plastocyanin
MTSTTKGSSKKNLALVGAAVAVGFLLTVAGMPSLSSAQTQEQGQEQQQQQTESATAAAQNGTTTTATRVDAGGGGPESVVTWFTPQNVTINAGETVVWINPTVVGEPHTVTFIREQGYFANFESPFLIPNGTELTPANPEEKNTEPLIIPGQPPNGDGTPAAASNDIIVAANARSTNPVVIDVQQNNVTYLPLNANYTMTGDELYVNSGWMWPAGQAPPGAPPIKSFSVTFANAGTYDYICLVHPWMTGQVVVQ